MLHRLKIERCFADAILSGEKTFEIRKNDRGFQNGDTIQFLVYNVYGTVKDYDPWHDLHKKFYRITYILSGWGLEPGYVALAIKPLAEADE